MSSAMKLSSIFQDGENIPERYSYNRGNKSPPLDIVRCLALTVMI